MSGIHKTTKSPNETNETDGRQRLEMAIADRPCVYCTDRPTTTQAGVTN